MRSSALLAATRTHSVFLVLLSVAVSLTFLFAMPGESRAQEGGVVPAAFTATPTFTVTPTPVVTDTPTPVPPTSTATPIAAPTATATLIVSPPVPIPEPITGLLFALGGGALALSAAVRRRRQP